MALMECPECKRSVSDKAPNCVHCGFPLTTARAAAPKSSAPPPAVEISTRKGVAQAIENRQASGFWIFQVVVASAIAGFATKSWWVFGGVFLGLAIVAQIPFIGKLVGLVMAAASALLVYGVCQHFGAPEAAGYVLGGLVFLATLGANLAMSQHVKDLRAEAKG